MKLYEEQYSTSLVLKWLPSAFNLSLMLLIFVATSFVFGAITLHFPWYWGAVAVLVMSAVKETTFDIYVEGDIYRDGLIDWLFYGLGCLVAWAVTLL